MSSSVTSKFKKGDKVRCIEWSLAAGVDVGQVYTVKGYKGRNNIYLEEVDGSPYENRFELVERCNYRKMKPTDLIKINIDGNESEVPLGDLVHATRLLGVTNGFYGARIWEALYNVLGEDGFRLDNTVIEFKDKQKETLDYFFKPYYDKLQQEKEELANLISKKQNELNQLVEKLNQM